MGTEQKNTGKQRWQYQFTDCIYKKQVSAKYGVIQWSLWTWPLISHLSPRRKIMHTRTSFFPVSVLQNEIPLKWIFKIFINTDDHNIVFCFRLEFALSLPPVRHRNCADFPWTGEHFDKWVTKCRLVNQSWTDPEEATSPMVPVGLLPSIQSFFTLQFTGRVYLSNQGRAA